MCLTKHARMMLYPIGLQDFENIRRDGYVYVDKTASVYKLAKTRRLENWKLGD